MGSVPLNEFAQRTNVGSPLRDCLKKYSDYDPFMITSSIWPLCQIASVIQSMADPNWPGYNSRSSTARSPVRLLMFTTLRTWLASGFGIATTRVWVHFPIILQAMSRLQSTILLSSWRWCNRRTPSDGFAEQNGRDAERAD